MRFIYLIFLFSLPACQPEKQDEATTTAIKDTVALPEPSPAQNKPGYLAATVNDSLAEVVGRWLREYYLQEEISALQADDRKFQLYPIDLNKDGKQEVFIRFLSPYFCGSGGCTFLLLTDQLKIITRFTVTRAPIFVEPTLKNGWPILLVKDNGVFKELVYKEGSYPPNPSVIPKAPYDAPNGHAQVLFGEQAQPPMTYTF